MCACECPGGGKRGTRKNSTPAGAPINYDDGAYRSVMVIIASAGIVCHAAQYNGVLRGGLNLPS